MNFEYAQQDGLLRYQGSAHDYPRYPYNPSFDVGESGMDDDQPTFDSQQAYMMRPSHLGVKRPLEETYDDDLDYFDRALLAESEVPPRRQVAVGISPTFSGRLSLPGPTAPALPSTSQALEPRHPDPGKTQGYGSRTNLRKRPGSYARTPPDHRRRSSTTTGSLASSPTAHVRQRRPPQSKIRPRPQIGAKSETLFRTTDHRFDSYTPNDLNSYHTRASQQPVSLPIGQNTTIPMAQGICLVSPHELPDRFRSVFRFPVFNAIQSKCFSTAYHSNDNLVVSAPTGGGKTVILELSICRLLNASNHFKVVYMAPTKSLCSERHRDWQAKFDTIGIQSAELTGDTDTHHHEEAKSAHIIITTPEKWDSMTRKWKDHAKLMQMVRLVLIDEVHMLKDMRGATLEAVISRMKSIGAVRFVALSATVPNSEDIAIWLGKTSQEIGVPAVREIFGEEFRPVKLQKYIVGVPYRGNDFGFEKACDPDLPAIIVKYSQQKPIMIFCSTRKSTIGTAKALMRWWNTLHHTQRCWPKPSRALHFGDEDLTDTVKSGVAFHHAGLDSADRNLVEKGFLDGAISVICCTSTLAMGVNLPCHLVIIKNTMGYQDDGLKEYSDLEIIQMLGRAGRPQFDTSAIAVIITREDKVSKYEKLMEGSELLESSLHVNLIEHLNAEVSLGTIRDIASAKNWLGGTFLYVRLQKNPGKYKVEGDSGETLEERATSICNRDLTLLEGAQLITSDQNGYIHSTRFGDLMASYYVSFETMKLILGLPTQAKVSDILSAVVQANEYRDIRFKSDEKKLYKEINRHDCIKFPITADLAQHAHKRTLIVQAELGCVDFPADEEYRKMRSTYMREKNKIFVSVLRLVRCAIDCQIETKDAVSIRNSLELARSLGAKVWDNSPFQMKQIPQIGPVAVRRLVNGGITSVEALEAAEPYRIEMLLSKNPPFGSKIVASSRAFPKLMISTKMIGKYTEQSTVPSVKFKIEWGFMNEKPTPTFQRKPIQIILVVERSDGLLVDFSRMPASTLVKNHHLDATISAQITNANQFFTCFIMCDSIAGTLRYAELRPELLPSCFPLEPPQIETLHATPGGLKALGGSKFIRNDEFEDADIDDSVFVDVARISENNGFSHIDDIGEIVIRSKNKVAGGPEKLSNGKWACRHNCKNKTACKHRCCQEGLEKIPKPPEATPKSGQEKSSISATTSKHFDPTAANIQTQVQEPKVKLANDRRVGQGQSSYRRDEAHNDTKRIEDPEMQTFLNDIELEDQQLEPFTVTVDENSNQVDKLNDYSDSMLDDLPSLTDLGVLESASTRMKRNMDAQSSSLQDGAPMASPGLNVPYASATTDIHNATENTGKLFMSTDTLDESNKENFEHVDGAESASNSLGDIQHDVLIELEDQAPAEDVKSQGADGESMLKAGLPAWAYDFGDPAFIAEWQNYVNLV